MNSLDEIWITGAGMMTSVGNDKDQCFDAFCQGKVGASPLQSFDKSKFSSCHAYEILDREGGDRAYRATEWLCQVIREACVQARINPDMKGDLPVCVGTGLRELRSVELCIADAIPVDPKRLHFGTQVRSSVPACGPVYTISNACAASGFALAMGEDMIRLGQADMVVVAGCDSMTESMYGLLGCVNPQVPERLHVFDRHRKGVLLGEGAAAVIMETSSHAERRGVAPLAVLRSVGLSCGAAHAMAPDPVGIERAIADALQRGKRTPEEVDVIFVHGTGTASNDSTEGAVLSSMYQPGRSNVVLSGLKAMIGHTSGASGLVGVVTGLLTLSSKRIPPTVGLHEPIDEVEGLRIPTQVVEDATVDMVQVNAFGFGGINAVVLLEGVA